ncbi:MAG TPA: TonB family protein [Roseiarcus sp.]|nr:TonB family protein [Roseiarcus sp.]
MIPPKMDIKANSAERMLPGSAAASLSGRSRYVAPLIATVIYAALLAPWFFENRLGLVSPTVQEIPVEIIIEPPPAEPEAPPPDPKAPQAATQPIDEEPATDAPRAISKEKTEADGSNDASKSPISQQGKAPPPSSVDPANGGAEANPVKPLPDKADAEPLPASDSARETAEQADQQPQPAPQPDAQSPPKPEKQTATNGDQFPTFDSVPDVDFEALAQASTVAGGQARTTYLSTLYGMIVPLMHLPPRRHVGAKLEGTITFAVDGKGNLIQRRIAHSSGSHELDLAAFNAVGEAAPFPRPPRGAPMGMRFTYGYN